jgi:hypothetical protein
MGYENSKDGCESQRRLWKMGYETEKMDLGLKEHFKKLDMKLKGWI